MSEFDTLKTYEEFDAEAIKADDDKSAFQWNKTLSKMIYELKDEIDKLKKKVAELKMTRAEFLNSLYNENWY